GLLQGLRVWGVPVTADRTSATFLNAPCSAFASTPNPKPSTSHPQPQTLNTQPHAPNTQPIPRYLASGGRKQASNTG
ncbi:hypothetical protein T484DRAFT_1946579, partial [Baffinella frigidus]